MPRRSILSAAERESLLALPDTKDELIRHYTFSESDLSIIRQRRGPANRLGFEVQLCYLRFPGVILGADEPPFPPLLRLVANQLKVGIESWDEYGQREGTVAKLAMRQPFVLFKGLTFQKLCLPGAFRPGDHHNK
ncbi:DUF4158 domain-containing protein, partial [Klebsiella variicola]